LFGPVPLERILGVMLRRYASDGPLLTPGRPPSC
jgi:hypothetical protein